MSLWTNLGGPIGEAIAGAIWNAKIPGKLRKHLPSTVSDQEVNQFFGKITLLHDYPMNSEIRQGAIKAFKEVNYILYCISLGLSFVPFIAALFQTNYFLDDRQNALEDEQSTDEEKETPKNRKDKLATFFS